MCAPHALNQDNQQEFKAPGVCKVGRSADISVGEDLPCGPSHSESPTRNSDGLIVIGQVMFSHSGKPKLFLAGPLKASCRPHLRRRLRPESASMAGSKTSRRGTPMNRRVGLRSRSTGRKSAEEAAIPTSKPLPANSCPRSPIHWPSAKTAHTLPATKGT